MKLSGARADGYIKSPDAAHAGVLIFGQNAMRVSLKREALIRNLAGENAEADMRLTRLNGADLRKDPAALLDAVKAVGFFPGHRVVFVEDASDGLEPVFKSAFEEWSAGDASIVATAGSLRATSKLRKLFEGGQATVGIGVYDDPPSPDNLMGQLRDQGLTAVSDTGREAVISLGMSVEPGDFAQFVAKLALYKHGDDSPISPEDVDAVAPAQLDAGVDDLIGAVADGQSDQIGSLLSRLMGQGTNPTTISIALGRHFRQLHAASSAAGGPDAALSRGRPPVFGPRKDKMLRQISGWGQARLEAALSVIVETELTLRSSKPYPPSAVLERALIRLAMMRPRSR
ncbi:MAG: DNA polymerase III subunit delta [Pseudomonadota bacterium]